MPAIAGPSPIDNRSESASNRPVSRAIPNRNTGEPLSLEPLTEKNTVVAKNTVQLNKQHASRVIAPLRL